LIILGYICSLLIGLALGTLGSGGSILTVPIMVYLMNVSPVDATGYSLFVVGTTSLIGFLNFSRKGKVEIKTAVIFAIPSLICVFLTRKFLVPSIPEHIHFFGQSDMSRDKFFMILFALLMLFVAAKILLGGKNISSEEVSTHRKNYGVLILSAVVAGFLTGFLGVGGGFIIIPSLMFFGKVSPKMSIGTSLLIIACNSFIGFMSEMIHRSEEIDYFFLLTFSAISVIGVLIGFKILTKITSLQLRNAFGFTVLLVGIYIFFREVVMINHL
jgi:uncharacterized membrane protein YfcA